jgi:hypothetical protein
MAYRFLCVAAIAIAIASPASTRLTGQAPAAAVGADARTAPSSANTHRSDRPAAASAGTAARGVWTPARTPDGQPDLQGYWTNATFTPLERPTEFAGKEFFTPEEAAAYEKQRIGAFLGQPADNIHYDDAIWQTEPYKKGVSGLRTSLIVDPADGRIPPLTPEGRRRAAERAARRGNPADAVSPGAPTFRRCCPPSITPTCKSSRAAATWSS